MSDVVIRVENLSKKYVIGRQGAGPSGEGLRHALQDAVAAPFRKLRARLATPDKPVNQAAAHGNTEEFYALRDVSFEVKRGEVLGIIGRNGAGKSTLLKILSRITEPTSGRIGLKGRVASLLEVGTGFHPELTGRENIYLNGAILGMSRAEVRGKFDEIVDFSGVETFLDTPVKRYSSGMYVRLAFAVAAHLEPEILVVDEVLAVGDIEFQKKCLGKMKAVASRGRTVLFVTHNMPAVSTLCTTAMLLRTGESQTYVGGPQSAIDDYMSSTLDAARSDVSKWVGKAGDEEVELFEFKALSENGNERFRTDRLIILLMELRVLVSVQDLVIGVHVESEDGRDIAFTGQFDQEEPGKLEAFAPGSYRYRVGIPPDTFAQGRYRLVPNIGIYNQKQILNGEASIAIDVINLHGLGRKFLGGKALESMFRPRWEWRLIS